MKQETIDGNRLIAEFMGFEKVLGKFYGGMKDEKGNSTYPAWSDTMNIILDSKIDIPEYGLKFNSSWDWLIPVVEKIYLMREVVAFTISLGEVEIKLIGREPIKSPCIPSNDSIKELWLAVVQFIKWYNTQNSNA